MPMSREKREVQKAQAENKANRCVRGEVNHGNNDNESPSGTPSDGNRQKFSKQSCFSLQEYGKRLDPENCKLHRKIIEDYVSIAQIKLEEQIKKKNVIIVWKGENGTTVPIRARAIKSGNKTQREGGPIGI
ncbi:hypothetical protein O181_008461 [Austropuccinia psidii MF-1]|uniref:Uncharacterized protein n=1 Tax=Austropuccinia psidii MF-1 TaxID=1389203 RepID=A0A9Q3GIJ3_9BASI|nr:hypothetical protein [Austropuccinia psidii MF-1]